MIRYPMQFHGFRVYNATATGYLRGDDPQQTASRIEVRSARHQPIVHETARPRKRIQEGPFIRMCWPRCMYLSRIEQENRARWQNMGRSLAVTPHRAPFDDSYRWNGMKVMCKFILPIRTSKQFSTAESAMLPDTSTFIPAGGPRTMVPVDMGVVCVHDSR